MKAEIPYGEKKIQIEIPQEHLLAVIHPLTSPESKNEEEIILHALQHPISSKPLRELAKGCQSAAIVVSDITRPCPTYKFLSFLLEEIPLENIQVIFALGIHRPLSSMEQKKLVGEKCFSRIKAVNFNPEDVHFLGETSRGTPVEVFRSYLEADLKICTGNIEYHYFAGFSGGAKAVMPGISSRRAIEHNHSFLLDPQAQPGKIYGNPVREDIEEYGKLAGIDFLFNVVLNQEKEIIGAFAGNFQKAFFQGASFYDRLFRTEINELADVIITSPGGHPKDLNLYQALKALENVRGALKPGGTIILVASCPEGFGEPLFEEWALSGLPPDELIGRLKEKFLLGAHKAALLAQMRKMFRIFLVSSFPPEIVRRIGLIPVDDLQKEVNKAIVSKSIKVLLVPYGNVVHTI